MPSLRLATVRSLSAGKVVRFVRRSRIRSARTFTSPSTILLPILRTRGSAARVLSSPRMICLLESGSTRFKIVVATGGHFHSTLPTSHRKNGEQQLDYDLT